MGELLPLSKVRSLGFGALKRYMKDVGLEVGKFSGTKNSMLRLITVKGLYLKEEAPSVVAQDQISSPSSAYRATPKLNSEGNAVAQSPPTAPNLQRRVSSVHNTDVQSISKAASEQLRIFRSFISSPFKQKSIENCLFYMTNVTPDELAEGVLSCKIEQLGGENIRQLGPLLETINLDDWRLACSQTYAVDEEKWGEASLRFFKFISIPKCGERMITISNVQNVIEELNKLHETAHQLFVALTEIAADTSLVKYLMCILMICRSKGDKIDLYRISGKVKWYPSPSLGLLRAMMELVGSWINLSDKFEAENFDKVNSRQVYVSRNEKKEKARTLQDELSSRLGISKETEDTAAAPTAAPAPRRLPASALMLELKKRVPTISEYENPNPRIEIRETKQEKIKAESQKNIKKIEFQISDRFLNGCKQSIHKFKHFIAANELESVFEQSNKQIDESFERLNATNSQVLQLWKDVESGYFQQVRTEFLKSIADPEFSAIREVVEGKWGCFLPDTVWGHIWEFRQPFQKRIDLRFAFTILEEYEEKFGKICF